MEPLYRCCAGLDIHKDTVVACVRHLTSGGRVRQQTRTFGTTTAALLGLLDWLLAEGVRHVAMESTGVYWKPVFNLLEGAVSVLLVNAQHVKHVPGRKTDVQDCAWLAHLLQVGLLKPSFVAPAPVRELRELTRQRTQLAGERAAAANRIQKVLEDASIKLGSVVADILGESGRAMLGALANGLTDPGELAELARGRLRAKLPALRLALQGRVTEHHRFLLRLLLDHVEQLDALMGRLSGRVEELLTPFAATVQALQAVPGVGPRAAEVLVAEIGPSVDPFPTAHHLASWAGMCPGHEESAGKRHRGRVRISNRWLKQALVQMAWAASHSKGTYLAAQYRRLARRRGKKRALVAVGHSILVIVYHLLKRQLPYQELGPDYLDRQESERLARQLVRRLESLGHKVTLEPKPAA